MGGVRRRTPFLFFTDRRWAADAVLGTPPDSQSSGVRRSASRERIPVERTETFAASLPQADPALGPARGRSTGG
jgi:hypothetical protein